MALKDLVLITKAVARRFSEKKKKKKGFLKSFAKFTGKGQSWSLFLKKVLDLQPETLLKKDLNVGVFL